MPKFFIKTYGCQMNERDSEQVAHSLVARGYERVGHESEADVVLLNTCSVRDMADQKALGKMGMLGRLAKERPHVVFGFLGCMAQARGASLLKDLPHVDLVVGTQKFHRMADYVDEVVAKKTAQAAGVSAPSYSVWPNLPAQSIQYRRSLPVLCTINRHRSRFCRYHRGAGRHHKKLKSCSRLVCFCARLLSRE